MSSTRERQNRDKASMGHPGPMFTIEQVAELLQVSAKTVRRWIGDGKLVAHRFGRQWRISEDDLHTFIRLRRQS